MIKSSYIPTLCLHLTEISDRLFIRSAHQLNLTLGICKKCAVSKSRYGILRECRVFKI